MLQGGDTTTSALSAMFFYLSRYPLCYQQLVAEIRSTFTHGSEIVSGTKLSNCAYLRACIDETLRISPPIVTTLWRKIATDYEDNEPFIVDGHFIPPGTDVGVNIFSIHHNHSYFPEPFIFKPERWLPGVSSSETEGRAIHDAFTPFSMGPRGCAGKTMA
jgi:cytochrome P450